MGNPKHLEWLLEGVEAWNKRREVEPFAPDLSGINIRQAFIDKGVIIENEQIPLGGANLRGAILFRANLSGAYLEGTNLRGADLEETILFNAKLFGANLRGAKLFVADLRRADLRKANLVDAILFKANLKRADLREAWLEGANLAGANLRKAKLEGANLRKAKLEGADVTTIAYTGLGINSSDITEYTDLSAAHFLTQEQIESANGDTGTILPDNLTRPDDWPDWRDKLDETPRNPEPKLPETQTAGDTVSLENGKITVRDASTPERSDLETLFKDLKEDVEAFHRSANLGNLSPTFAAALDRFLDMLPDVFAEMDQTRFGIQSTNMRLKYASSKAEIEEIAPERIGFIEAILNSSELLAARLPAWMEFLSETDDEETAFQENEEAAIEALEEAAKDITNNPDVFDASVSQRIREYLDTKIISGYLASQHLIANTAHLVFSALKRTKDWSLATAGKVAKESENLAIKGVAGLIVGGMAVGLTKALLLIADTYPKFAWIRACFEYAKTFIS